MAAERFIQGSKKAHRDAAERRCNKLPVLGKGVYNSFVFRFAKCLHCFIKISIGPQGPFGRAEIIWKRSVTFVDMLFCRYPFGTDCFVGKAGFFVLLFTLCFLLMLFLLFAPQ